MSIIHDIANELHRSIYKDDPETPFVVICQQVREVVKAIGDLGFIISKDHQPAEEERLCGYRWSSTAGHHVCDRGIGHPDQHMCKQCEAQRW